MKKLRPAYWTLALMLCLMHIGLLVMYTHMCLSTGNQISPSALGYWITIVVAIALLCLSLVVKTKNQNRATILGLVPALFLVGLLCWYLQDDPPMENDYSEKDLRIASAGGYQELAPFYSDEKAKALQKQLGVCGQQKTESRQGQAVLQAWARIAEFRAAIEALNRFEIISDLPEDAVIHMDMAFMKFTTLKRVTDVYRNYIRYQLRNGDAADALRHLGQLHGLARKGMAGSALLIHKIMFAALAQKTMAAAYEVIDDEQCRPDMFKSIKNDFTPFEPWEYDMRRVFIGEYLFFKAVFTKRISAENFLMRVQSDDEFNYPWFELTSLMQRPFFYLLYKPNISLAAHRKQFELLIAAEGHQPPDYTKAQRYIGMYKRQPSLRNMIGWTLNNIATPDFSNYSQKVHSRKVQSDLLACAISNRLNEPVTIVDYYTKGPCRYKEAQGILRSPGADSLYDTEDDITLEKAK